MLWYVKKSSTYSCKQLHLKLVPWFAHCPVPLLVHLLTGLTFTEVITQTEGQAWGAPTVARQTHSSSDGLPSTQVSPQRCGAEGEHPKWGVLEPTWGWGEKLHGEDHLVGEGTLSNGWPRQERVGCQQSILVIRKGLCQNTFSSPNSHATHAPMPPLNDFLFQNVLPMTGQINSYLWLEL